jgi:hypothetical protein
MNWWKRHKHNWILVGISNDPSPYEFCSYWVFQCADCGERKDEKHKGNWQWKQEVKEPEDIKELNRIYKLK